MINFIPRPLRDLVTFRDIVLERKKDPHHLVNGTVLRTYLAAITSIALYRGDVSLQIVASAGVVISLPVTAIALGNGLLYYSAMMTSIAISTKSFAALGVAFGSLAGGYITLEFHDFIKFGIGELFYTWFKWVDRGGCSEVQVNPHLKGLKFTTQAEPKAICV